MVQDSPNMPTRSRSFTVNNDVTSKHVSGTIFNSNLSTNQICLLLTDKKKTKKIYSRLLTMLFIFCVSWTSTTRTETPYQHLRFEASTGIYYEHQGPVRRRISNWRINTFLHVGKLYDSLAYYQLKMKTLTKHCRPRMEEDCQRIVTDYDLQPKLDAASRLRDIIHQEVEDMAFQSARKITEYSTKRCESKKIHTHVRILSRDSWYSCRITHLRKRSNDGFQN